MFKEKIKSILNSEKENPFLHELEIRFQLENAGQNVYKRMTKLIDCLFFFCEENNISDGNEFHVKDKAILTHEDYLYFKDEGGLFNLATTGYLYSYFRVKNVKDIFGIYQFEYYLTNESKTNEILNLEYKIIDDKEKKDMNFNFIFCNHLSYVAEMLFNH